jgi:hypothetical protein
MQYMLLIYLNDQGPSEAEREQCYRDSAAFARQLHAKGHYVHSAPLYPAATATSLRHRDGKRLVTDGPFAETREQLGGFFLIDAADLGTVEIRPVVEISGLPDGSDLPVVDHAPSRST